MPIIATTHDQVLFALIFDLRKKGWDLLDVDKLVDVYDAYQRATGAVIYGSVRNPTRGALKDDLVQDLKDLENRQLVQRTVSRVQLTTLGLPAAASLTLHPHYRTLIKHADVIFPPRSAP